MTPLIQRASTGDKPLLPIAIVTGERSTIAGMMNVQSAWIVDDVAEALRGRRPQRRRPR